MNVLDRRTSYECPQLTRNAPPPAVPLTFLQDGGYFHTALTHPQRSKVLLTDSIRSMSVLLPGGTFRNYLRLLFVIPHQFATYICVHVFCANVNFLHFGTVSEVKECRRSGCTAVNNTWTNLGLQCSSIISERLFFFMIWQLCILCAQIAAMRGYFKSKCLFTFLLDSHY